MATDNVRAMDTHYKYQRLDPSTDAIRLVRVLKGDTGPIECEMIETYLHQVEDGGVPYEALSYVWGDSALTKEIRVDGCLLAVTENLSEALSNLRRPGEDRLLWIDAICIDQNHHAERGHQVAHMRDIYRNAHMVIIWLGDTTIEINCLFYWMRRLDQRMVASECQPTMTMWKLQWDLLSLDPECRVYSYSMRRGLGQLLAREWFRRIWVIQEAALAKAATISCGRNNISSRTFVVMPLLLDQFCRGNQKSRLEIMPGLLRKKSWWSSGPASQDLGMLLQKFGTSEAREPRDIIYALLGLCKDAFTSNSLRPDYEISLQEAIQRTVVYLLVRWGHATAETCPAYYDMPPWSMREFLSALEDLPYRVYWWGIGNKRPTIPKPDATFPLFELGNEYSEC